MSKATAFTMRGKYTLCVRANQGFSLAGRSASGHNRAQRLFAMRHSGIELSGTVAAGPARGVSMWRRAFHWLRVVFCGLAFAGFGVGGILLARVVLPLLSLWPGSTFKSRQRCQALVRCAWVVFHDYMRLVGLVNFNHRRCRIALTRPSVIIANHPTLVDITALVCALGPVCFVAKRPLFRNVLFGPLLHACGHICSVDSDGSEGPGALEQALARLAEGHSVLLFPEGTRSPPHALGRFRMGAFELARRAQVPLVVIGVTAEPLGLNKGVPWYRIPPVAMDLSLHQTMTFDSWQDVPNLRALAQLRTRVRQLVMERFIDAAPEVPQADESVA